MSWMNTQWNTNVNIKPLNGGIFSFEFPSDPGHVDLIALPHDPILVGPNRPPVIITMRYSLSPFEGEPVVVSVDTAVGLPPNMRPMVQQVGDTFSGDAPNGRFWPAGLVYAPLVPGTHDYSVVMRHDLWSNVFGAFDQVGFKQCCKHLGNISLAFGGGASFSHGVYVKGGRMVFRLLSFSVK